MNWYLFVEKCSVGVGRAVGVVGAVTRNLGLRTGASGRIVAGVVPTVVRDTYQAHLLDKDAENAAVEGILAKYKR